MAEEIIYSAGTPVKQISSGPFSLNWRDAGKGAILAAITALLRGVYEALELGGIPTTWIALKPIVMTAAIAFIGYLMKNFFEPAKVVIPTDK